MFTTAAKPLHEKKCVPASDDMLPLRRDAAEKLLEQVGGRWRLNQKGRLFKEYRFDNFRAAMDFANKVAQIAEREAHHPEFKISWGMCVVEIYTHNINALSENDFILAAKIEQAHKD